MAENIGTLLVRLGLNLSQFTAGLAEAKSAMARAGAKMQAVGKNLTMRLTAPLTALGGLFGKLAIDFQASMRKINTLVGLGVDRLNGMTKDVIALSNQTGRGATELADALFVITSAGQRGKEAMQILERSAKATALGLGETKEVARTVTAVLNAYGKENYSAARATDILVGIIREGNLVAEELSPVLGRVIGIATQVGISFEEVGASVATFTRLGVDAAEAVTGLRGIINSLLKPSEGGAKALATIGMNFKSLRKKIREDGLAESLIFLVEKFKNNAEAISDIVPNVRALSAWLGTAGAQSESYAEILGKLTNELNHVDNGFASISQDSGFLLGQTIQQLKNAAMELGNIMLPVFNKVLKVVVGLVKKFTALSTTTKNFTLVVFGVLAAVGPLVYLFGGLASAIGIIVGPIGAVILAIGVLAGAIFYLYDNWLAVTERISDWSWWKNMIIDMFSFLSEWNPFSLMIKGYNTLVEMVGGNPLPNPFEIFADALNTLKDDTDDYEHSFKDLGETIDSIKSKLKGFLNLTKSPPLVLPKVMGPGYDMSHLPEISRLGTKLKEFPETLSKVAVGVDNTRRSVISLGTGMQNVLNDAFTEFATTLGNVFTGDAGAYDFFQGLLTIVASFMKSFGKALIAAGVASKAFKELLWNPWAAIGAGVALIAASTVVSNLLKKGMQPQGLRSGGFVKEGGLFQLHRNEQVALPAGSAVTSARMLGQSNKQEIIVSGRIIANADELLILIEEAIRRRDSIN